MCSQEISQPQLPRFPEIPAPYHMNASASHRRSGDHANFSRSTRMVSFNDSWQCESASLHETRRA